MPAEWTRPGLWALVFAGTATAGAAAGAHRAQSDRPQPFATLDALVADELARTGAPGAAVAVVSGERVVLAGGYGFANAETGSAATPDTQFQIGSVTKAFTAATLLASMAQGERLSTDTQVGTLVTGLVPCLRGISIGQLLSHTGGLIDEPAEFGPHGEEELASYPRSWGHEYCLIPPGRAFSYSNSGYALAGLALQEHEKKPFADLVRLRVLDPLGMTRTTFRPTEAMTYPLAVGHRRKDGAVQVVRPLPNDARLWPAGTLYSSANEMAQLLIALLNEGRAGGRQALPAAVVRSMMTPHATRMTVGGDYGFGLELDTFRSHRRVGHGGAMTGYAAQISLLPERRIGVVVLANGDGALLWRVAERALELALGDTPPAAAPSPTASPEPSHVLTTAQLDRYVGTFSNPRRFTVEVVRQGDTLILRRFGRDFPMRAVSPERFLVQRPGGDDETIAFGFDPDGRPVYLLMNVWALARQAP